MAEFSKSIFSKENFILFCKFCNVKVANDRRLSITQETTPKNRQIHHKYNYTYILFFASTFLTAYL